MKQFFYVCLTVMFCVLPIFGCDQDSTPSTPDSSGSTTDSSGNSYIVPVDFVIDSGFCQIPVYNSVDDDKGDFEMTITCFRVEWFHIQIDNYYLRGGKADGIDVDVMGRNFLTYGTLE